MFTENYITGSNHEAYILIENGQKEIGEVKTTIEVTPGEHFLWLTLTAATNGFVNPQNVTVTMVSPEGTVYQNGRGILDNEEGKTRQSGNEFAYALIVDQPASGKWALTVKDDKGSPFFCQCFVVPKLDDVQNKMEHFQESSAGRSFAEFCAKLPKPFGFAQEMSANDPCLTCTAAIILALLAVALVVLLLAFGAGILSIWFPPLLAVFEVLAKLGIIIAIAAFVEFIRYAWDVLRARTPETLSREICRWVRFCP